MPTAPTSVIIELESALIELRDVIQELITANGIVHIWPSNTRQRFETAIKLVFDDVLSCYLKWTGVKPQTLEMQHDRCAGVFKHIGLTECLSEHSDFLDILIDPLAELVERPIRRQLDDLVAKYPYYAWHVADVKSTQFVLALIPGGIMIDLDRLKDASGIVEIDLATHWKPVADVTEPVLMEALGNPLTDEQSRALKQEALGRSPRKLYPRSK